MSVKKQVDLKFRLMLQANVGYLVRSLGVAFLLFTLSLIIFATFAVTYSHTNLGLIVGMICLVSLAMSANLIIYILNLSFRTGMVLVMDRRGLVDLASPVQWGLLKIQEIEYIKFSYSLMGDFLKVKMKQRLPLNTLSGIRKWNAKLMAMVDPTCVYIPLEVLDVTRMNLETQLLHFGALMKLSEEDKLDSSQSLLDLMKQKYDLDEKQSAVSSRAVPEGTVMMSVPKVPEDSVSQAEVELTEMTSTNYEVVNDTGNFDIPARSPASLISPDTSTNHTFVPPSLDPTLSEKSRLIQQISALKTYVKKRKLDEKVCDLYTDYVSQFPKWEQTNDGRLPIGVVKSRYLDQRADYEEVHFQFRDATFQFSLRKDIGPSDMALLSVGFQGRVKMAIRVTVEIAALEPKDVEVFHRDHWEQYFLDLYKVCISGRFGSQPMRELDAETRTLEVDLDRLKENFSSGDDD